MSPKAVITGASVGIGAATARLFAAEGYDLIINYFHSQTDAEELKNDCAQKGIKVELVKADCSTQEGIQSIADKAAEQFGQIDVLVNNFGVARETEFEKANHKDIVETLNNTLISTILATRIFVPQLIKPGGSVLNLATIYGLNQSGSVGLPVYSAAKAGIINFTQTMAKKYAPDIRFNVVAPGFTKTPHWNEVDSKRAEDCINSTLQQEWVQPEDIASALLFLANSPHINAETIVVDAGWSKK